jgi:hypothetical protein
MHRVRSPGVAAVVVASCLALAPGRAAAEEPTVEPVPYEPPATAYLPDLPQPTTRYVAQRAPQHGSGTPLIVIGGVLLSAGAVAMLVGAVDMGSAESPEATPGKHEVAGPILLATGVTAALGGSIMILVGGARNERADGSGADWARAATPAVVPTGRGAALRWSF